MTVPSLVRPLLDPLAYDLTPFITDCEPLPLVLPKVPKSYEEPPDGSLIRFQKAGGRYLYVAMRQRDYWHTTATGDWGSVNQVMPWRDLAPHLREFDVATQFVDVLPTSSEIIHPRMAAARFVLENRVFCAVNVCEYRNAEGDWYTTISDDEALNLPLGKRAVWSEILNYGRYVQIASAWAHIA